MRRGKKEQSKQGREEKDGYGRRKTRREATGAGGRSNKEQEKKEQRVSRKTDEHRTKKD